MNTRPAGAATLDEWWQHAQLDQLFEAAPEGLVLLDSDERVIRANPEFFAMFGLGPEAVLGRAINDLIAPDELRGEADAITLRVAGGERVVTETVRRRGDGTPIDVSLLAVPIRLEGGQVGVAGIYRDISERVQAERERERLHQRERDARASAEAAERRAHFLAEVSSLLDRSLDYQESFRRLARMVLPFLADYCLIDEVRDDGKLRRVAAAHVNPSREGFFYTGAEHAYTASMSHHPTVQVFHTRRPVLVPEATEQVLDEISHSAEHRERLLRIGLCSFVIVPLIARDRALGTLTLAMADSERRYSEAELPLLEEVARRAAIALDNARLYGKEQQAVAAREQILAVVSHDLRNPLASLMIDASCITDGVDGVQVPEPILERAERISEGAEQMNRMIGDLLDAALIDAGRLRVHPGRCSLEGLLRTAVTRQRPLAEANRIRMGFVVDGEAEAVWADRERLLQLFSNLFANALRLTPPGGEVGVRATGAPDGCRFEVWDTGPGIAPEHRERIWEAHWQVPGERRRGGGGLGLAIARGIVEAHGGRIWVESTEGEGSRFFFTVPTLPREAGE